MSVVTRNKRLSESLFPFKSEPEFIPAAPAARHEAEAPERATCPREAPESRPGRLSAAEARDAGEGRANHLEHGFTHGRSQS